MGKKYNTRYSDDLAGEVLTLLKSNPNLTCQQIANILNKPYCTIVGVRKDLKKGGFLDFLFQVSKENNNKRIIQPIEQVKINKQKQLQTQQKQTNPTIQKPQQKRPLTLREAFIIAKRRYLLEKQKKV
jgi:hypothetical protein